MGKLKIQVLPISNGFILQTTTSTLSLLTEKVDDVKKSSLKISPSNVSLAKDEEQQAKENAFFVDALIGIVKGVSHNVYYLLVVEESSLVGDSDFQVQQIKSIQVIPFPNQVESHADRVQIEYIESSLKKTPFMYFSHSRDIVRSIQAQQLNPLTDTRKSIFVWNWKFLEPLYAQAVPKQWIHPIIQGLVAFRPNIRALDLCFDMVLITRRANTNQGTRFHCRGLDENGCAANFCETEQIFLFKESRQGIVSSFLQIRGSIPTRWKQESSLWPKNQRATLLPEWASTGFNLFVKHLQNQLVPYGPNIILVNLIDNKGSSKTSQDQARLGAAFKEHVDRISTLEKEQTKQLPQSKLVWFDFHHETKKGWDKLSKLLEEVEPDFATVSFCLGGSVVDSKLKKQQTGCFRVNCMDNLDRTNVVQSMFARKSAMDQFSFLMGGESNAANLSSNLVKDVFNSGFPEFEKAFKEMWADNADAVSLAYAGSNALKTDFTRTGKRSLFGPLQDGFNSVTRLFVNNFLDHNRQDEIDVLLLDEVSVHKVLISEVSNKGYWWTPTKQRLGVLLVSTLGYLAPIIQSSNEFKTPYFLFLINLTAFVVLKQSKERPRFFRRD